MKNGGKPTAKDLALEFKNKGRLKDLSGGELRKMFKELLDSRVKKTKKDRTPDTYTLGEVVDDVLDGSTRELHFENLRFTNGLKTFLLEANTFLDFRWRTKANNAGF